MTVKCDRCSRAALVIEPYGVLCGQCWLQHARVYHSKTTLDNHKPTRYTMKANKTS
jgi:hypothetical protein